MLAISLLTALMLQGALPARAAESSTVARSAPGAPSLRLEALERTAEGWTTVESSGDAKAGRVAIERVVWPLFYLHWRPLSGQGGVGEKLSVAEAERAVAGLWEGLTIDSPLEGKKIALGGPGGHEAVAFETTTSHGGWRSRYLVWACPESGRLFIADANANLQVNVPASLLDLMTDIARSVRCHPGAKIEERPALTKRREIPDTDISYSIPYTWSPVAGYRVQSAFAEGQFAANTHPAATQQQGQDLVLELDSVRRLLLLWEPAPDAAMTFDTLIERVHEFWKERASNILPAGTRVSNDVWIMDGLVQFRQPIGIPPSRMHKFRAWLWRKNGLSSLAVGELGGIRFGQRVMTEIQQVADPLLEEMFQSIDY